ncbi:MAG: hypothetical protein MHM6MM_007443 [Cercozoa sp. M6MM]
MRDDFKPQTLTAETADEDQTSEETDLTLPHLQFQFPENEMRAVFAAFAGKGITSASRGADFETSAPENHDSHTSKPSAGSKENDKALTPSALLELSRQCPGLIPIESYDEACTLLLAMKRLIGSRREETPREEPSLSFLEFKRLVCETDERLKGECSPDDGQPQSDWSSAEFEIARFIFEKQRARTTNSAVKEAISVSTTNDEFNFEV